MLCSFCFHTLLRPSEPLFQLPKQTTLCELPRCIDDSWRPPFPYTRKFHFDPPIFFSRTAKALREHVLKQRHNTRLAATIQAGLIAAAVLVVLDMPVCGPSPRTLPCCRPLSHPPALRFSRAYITPLPRYLTHFNPSTPNTAGLLCCRILGPARDRQRARRPDFCRCPGP